MPSPTLVDEELPLLSQTGDSSTRLTEVQRAVLAPGRPVEALPRWRWWVNPSVSHTHDF